MLLTNGRPNYTRVPTRLRQPIALRWNEAGICKLITLATLRRAGDPSAFLLDRNIEVIFICFLQKFPLLASAVPRDGHRTGLIRSTPFVRVRSTCSIVQCHLDPLSDILSFLKPQSYLSAGLDAGGTWGLSFAAHGGIKFNAVLRGECWLSVANDAKTYHLREGDCFLLTKGRPFVLASDLTAELEDAEPIYHAAVDRIARCNGGGDFLLIGGRFFFAENHARPLFDCLPPVVHIKQSSDQASVLRWSLAQFAAELTTSQAGGGLVAKHLAHIMLIQILRKYLVEVGHGGVGWLYALVDRRLAPVIAAIHQAPSHQWTVFELARLANMSRSNFAAYFRRIVGVSPMEYVTRWRMIMAVERIKEGKENISLIARSLGYESESAFSTAFKREMAQSPKQFQRQHMLHWAGGA